MVLFQLKVIYFYIVKFLIRCGLMCLNYSIKSAFAVGNCVGIGLFGSCYLGYVEVKK